MKYALRTFHTQPIGIDLGQARLKMAQTRTSKAGVELLAASTVDVPADCRQDLARRLDFQSQSIRNMLKTFSYKGNQAIISVPAADIFLQPVKVPIIVKKGMEEVIAKELQGKLPYPVENAIIRNIFADTVYNDREEMQEQIVAAVSRAQVDSYIAMANQAGIEVIGMDIEACAVVECFSRLFRRQADQSRVILFIDIGYASTQVVLTRGKKMIFARNVPVGGLALDQMIAESLQISVQQAEMIRRKMLSEEKDVAAEDDLFRLLDVKIAQITDDIMQCLRYYESVFKNQAIERVIFVGGEAHNRRLCQSIASHLNLPAQVGDPMVGVKLAHEAKLSQGLDVRTAQPSWAVAIGLSLGATVTAA